MNWINVSFSIPYWLPSQEMVLFWCLMAMAEVLLCSINAVMFDLRLQTSAAVFRNQGNEWWEKIYANRGFRPGRAGSMANVVMAFLLWPVGLPREIKTFIFQARLDWTADAERLERETKRYRRKAA